MQTQNQNRSIACSENENENENYDRIIEQRKIAFVPLHFSISIFVRYKLRTQSYFAHLQRNISSFIGAWFLLAGRPLIGSLVDLIDLTLIKSAQRYETHHAITKHICM